MPSVCRLCDSVANTLVGKKLSSFTRVSSAVRTAVEEAITRILTPKRSIDVLREAQQARSRYTLRHLPFCLTSKSMAQALSCYETAMGNACYFAIELLLTANRDSKVL